MDRQGTRLGLASVVFAGLAIVLGVWGFYFESVRGEVSAHVLKWLDAYGLVQPLNPASVPEMRSPSAFLLTDPIVVRWLTVHTWWFSACAILFALWAEARREATSFLSAGFVLGSMALLFVSLASSVGAMFAGGLCVAWLRRRAGRLTCHCSGLPSAAAEFQR